VGIRLFVEVLDYAPATLTHREKLILAVLAEDAPDKTRVTWSSVEDPKILRRGKVTRPQMYEVLKALTAKGVLKKASAGQKNAVAKYELLPLTPSQCPEIPDTERPSQDPETPDTEPDFQRPDSPDTDEPQSPETPDTKAEVQGSEIPDTDDFQRPDSADTDDSQCPEIPVSVSGNPGRLPQPPTTKRSLSPRADVEQVCTHLADRIEGNGSKRPAITEAWRTAARLLIDKDGRTVDQILRAIDWCQADPFWRANVLSLPKLRERYDQLRLKATAEREQARQRVENARKADPTQHYADRNIF
jgi:hypothetical protein